MFNLLTSLMPLILFFMAYKYGDIYLATAVLMTSQAFVYFIKWMQKKVEKSDTVSLILIFIFGLLTLSMKDPYFIKIKPTILYFIFGVALIVSELINKSLMKSMFLMVSEKENKDDFTMPNDEDIKKGSYYISAVCFFMSILNLYVAEFHSEAAWVNFKIYSGIIFSILVVAIMLKTMISKQMKSK